jgi:hypothetical protein
MIIYQCGKKKKTRLIPAIAEHEDLKCGAVLEWNKAGMQRWCTTMRLVSACFMSFCYLLCPSQSQQPYDPITTVGLSGSP